MLDIENLCQDQRIGAELRPIKDKFLAVETAIVDVSGKIITTRTA